MAIPKPDDLVLVSDSGKMYVVSMKEVDGKHEPESVSPLDDALVTTPATLRDFGVTFAVMPEWTDGTAGEGGVTCFLLNLKSVAGALHEGTSKPGPSPALHQMTRIRSLVQDGGEVAVRPQGKDEKTFTIAPEESTTK